MESIVSSYREAEPKYGEGVPTIQEGPQYVYAHGDDTAKEKWPFACRLMLHLQANGAVLAHQAIVYKHGDHVVSDGPVGSDRIINMWNQIHTSKDEPEAFGDRIMMRFGKLITFGEMIMPLAPHLQWVGYARSGPVWIRHIGDYHVGSDSVIQRWDALVRSSQA